MRQLALEFAMNIQPHLAKDQLQEIADALNGAKESVNKSCVTVPSDWAKKRREPAVWNQVYDNPIYVDYKHGNDNNDGSIYNPLKHIDTALILSRKRYTQNEKKTIILRAGRHYLRDTLYITPVDSNLLITNFDGEAADMSGAVPLTCTWKLYKNGQGGKNMYSCDLSSAKIDDIPGLRVNGGRAIRARYPNADPEMGFGSTLKVSSWMPSTLPTKPDQDIYPTSPVRNDTTANYFQRYALGIGGPCKGFTPQAGYWCSAHTQGGGGVMYKLTSGLTYSASELPHTPYKDGSQLVVQTWRPGHWSSWMFEVGQYDSSKKTMKFSKGGFQGARGNSQGDELYIENVMEEFDAPAEYFYNRSNSMLYYYNNITGDPSSLKFEATKLKVLVNHTGSMNNPVKGVTIQGITMRDTAYTYMDPHGMPSGGDWGLQRQGAIYMDGTENCVISTNLMTRLDGNAISINRYNRNLNIIKNEIVWNGDSAVTSWGDTENVTFTYDKTTMGPDGTNGNQPRQINLIQNFVHEIGIWEKQSSMWFQAKSCSNNLQQNIFFNGPRAGINFNDGFGGNSTLLQNLQFNTCRESGDHGPFNSWDRQVYVTKVRTGKPDVIKEYDHIQQNFFVANYNSQEAVDNDDGSCYYDTHKNFFAYSGNGMKNDFGGHDNHHYDNIYAYIGNHCFGVVGQIQGHQDMFYNNTCVLNKATSGHIDYGSFVSLGNQWPKLGNNKVYTLNGDATQVGLCGKAESDFQKANPGIDDGTQILKLSDADNSAILAQAKAMLFA